jgi:hydrogenase expression/formation protein HypC
MCLGVPGEVLELWSDADVLMGRVDFGGVSRTVCLDHVRDVVPGEYVLVHVGFALTKIDAEEAKRVFALLTELGELE